MSGKGRGIKPLKLSLLQSEAERSAVIAAALDDELRRLAAFADELGIPPGRNRWKLLALELWRKHESTSKPSRNDGRPQKWDVLALITLANLVALMMHVGCTKARACEYLAEKDPWLSTMEGRPDGNALEKQCTKDRLVAARKIVTDAADVGSLDALIALVFHQRDFLSQREKQK